jgi:hypothetical protein
MADQKINIKLIDFKPKTTITLNANTTDDAGIKWQSTAAIAIDERGYADLSKAKPEKGSYIEPDSMGLLWSMKPDPKTLKPSLFTKTGVEPTTISITAKQNGATIATTTCHRLFISPETTTQPLSERGLAGKFFAPKKPGRYPAVIFIEGSAGGIVWSEQMASVLASYGYVTLALAYFHYEGVPDEHVRIPLEYFETAMKWMEEQPSVMPGKFAVSGISRGGEGALLIGSTFPQVKCVVAYSPSNAAGGVPMIDPGVRKGCWTYRGVDIPYIERKANPGKVDEVHFKEPIAATPIFNGYYDFSSARSVDDGAIPVEKTNGAILMISGKDDRMWPSSMMSELVMKRLKTEGFSYTYRHLSYSGAGHYLMFPYLPSTVDTLVHPVDNLLYYVGGGGVDHYKAEVDSWKQVLEFLRRHYR